VRALPSELIATICSASPLGAGGLTRPPSHALLPHALPHTPSSTPLLPGIAGVVTELPCASRARVGDGGAGPGGEAGREEGEPDAEARAAAKAAEAERKAKKLAAMAAKMKALGLA